MNDQNQRTEASRQMQENEQEQSGSHDEVFKQVDKKALVVDGNGFVREIGEKTWRKYNPHSDQ